MPDIRAEDCRLEGFVSGRSARYYTATHLPTGVRVHFQNGYGTAREAMNALQRRVDEH